MSKQPIELSLAKVKFMSKILFHGVITNSNTR